MSASVERVAAANADIIRAYVARREAEAALDKANAALDESREAFYQALGIPRWVTPVTDLGPVGARDTS